MKTMYKTQPIFKDRLEAIVKRMVKLTKGASTPLSFHFVLKAMQLFLGAMTKDGVFVALKVCNFETKHDEFVANKDAWSLHKADLSDFLSAMQDDRSYIFEFEQEDDEEGKKMSINLVDEFDTCVVFSKALTPNSHICNFAQPQQRLLRLDSYKAGEWLPSFFREFLNGKLEWEVQPEGSQTIRKFVIPIEHRELIQKAIYEPFPELVMFTLPSVLEVKEGKSYKSGLNYLVFKTDLGFVMLPNPTDLAMDAVIVERAKPLFISPNIFFFEGDKVECHWSPLFMRITLTKNGSFLSSIFLPDFQSDHPHKIKAQTLEEDKSWMILIAYICWSASIVGKRVPSNLVKVLHHVTASNDKFGFSQGGKIICLLENQEILSIEVYLKGLEEQGVSSFYEVPEALEF